jgi:murein L,D-transpeptidase YafK
MIPVGARLRTGAFAAFLVISLIAVSTASPDKPSTPRVYADSVLVVKSERRLYLLKDKEVFAEYPATFGADPEGHKQREGDERTPEGHYILDWKNANSAYYKAIHVDYPNKQDQAAAAARGEDPGGLILIHGQRNGYGWLSPFARFFNWTDGCIALNDDDMEEVWLSVAANTPIEIRP